MTSRNRAVHGDLVVIELLPRSEWKGRSNVIKETSEHLGKLGKSLKFNAIYWTPVWNK
jgi:DIS3-like exonuclease 1